MARRASVVIRLFLLTVMLASSAVIAGCYGDTATAQVANLPAGLVQGARIKLLVTGFGAATVELLVMELRGNWVRTNIVDPEYQKFWASGDLWINLAAVNQLAIVPAGPKTPLK